MAFGAIAAGVMNTGELRLLVSGRMTYSFLDLVR